MALRNYTVMFKEVAKSRFLHFQVWTLFITTYIDWTIIPYVTKLEGKYLPVFMISFFMLLGALDGIVQPLFKHIKIYNIYLFTIILDILQIVSYSLINISLLLFTYVILSVFTIQAITFEIARVHTVDFMQDESIELKDYLMLRSFMISLAIVAGSISAMVLDYFDVDIATILIYISSLGVVGIYVQYKLYRIFKKRLISSEVQISKERRDLHEKLRGN